LMLSLRFFRALLASVLAWDIYPWALILEDFGRDVSPRCFSGVASLLAIKFLGSVHPTFLLLSSPCAANAADSATGEVVILGEPVWDAISLANGALRAGIRESGAI
jgi:hypothetical protein